jgi:hypothetical protein
MQTTTFEMIQDWAETCSDIVVQDFDENHEFSSAEALDTIRRFESLLQIKASLDLPQGFSEQLFMRLTGDEDFDDIVESMVDEAFDYIDECEY